MRFTLVLSLAILTAVCFTLAGLPNLVSASVGPIPLNCNRACLENVVDQYLAAVVAHDPTKVALSADAKYTSAHHVAMRFYRVL